MKLNDKERDMIKSKIIITEMEHLWEKWKK